MGVPDGEWHRRIKRREKQIDDLMVELRLTNMLLANARDVMEAEAVKLPLGLKVTMKHRMLINDKLISNWEKNHG